MKTRTTEKTHTQKDGTIWEWQETDEVIEALKKLHDGVPVQKLAQPSLTFPPTCVILHR